MSKQGDIQFIERLRKGERDAFKHLVLSYSSLFFTKAKIYSRNTQDAEDSLQDAYVTIYQKIEQFEGTELGRLLAWCQKIVINTCISKYRKHYYSHERNELTPQTDIEIAPDVFGQFEKSELLKLIQLLPEGYRQIFSLFAIEGYSHKEIAEMLNIKANTSRSQYLRAKRKLNVLMSEHSQITLSHGI